MKHALIKLMIVAMILALGTASAFASVWDAKTSEVAVRADHNPGDQGYTPDQQNEFDNTTGPAMNAANGEGSSSNLLDTTGDRPENTSPFLSQFFGIEVFYFYMEENGPLLGFFQSPTFYAELDGYTPASLGVFKYKEGQLIGALPMYSALGGEYAEDGMWVLQNAETGVMYDVNDPLHNGNYILMWYVKDNGPYDLDPTVGKIVDPVALGPVGGDDDSDSGCVLNPAATLSLEWLFVLLAPALLIFRRRK